MISLKQAAAAFAVAAAAMLCPMRPAQAQTMVIAQPVTYTGTVLALQSNFVDLNVSGMHLLIPAGAGPTFAVNGAAVGYGSLALGQTVAVTVPAFTGSIVDVGNGWLAMAEPSGAIVEMPIHALPNSLLAATDVALMLSSGSMQTLALASALPLLNQGAMFVVENPTLAVEPMYMDFGPLAFTGPIQSISPTEVVVLNNGTPMTLPVNGATFQLNGANVPLSRLHKGSRVTVHEAAVIGQVSGVEHNQVTLMTPSHSRINMPLSSLPSSVREHVHLSMRTSNGKIVRAPLNNTSKLQSQHAQLMAPRQVSQAVQPAPPSKAPGHATPANHLSPTTHGGPTTHTAPTTNHAAPATHAGPTTRHAAPAPTHAGPTNHTAPATHAPSPSHMAPESHAAPPTHTSAPAHPAPVMHQAPAPAAPHAAPAPHGAPQAPSHPATQPQDNKPEHGQ